MLRLNKLTDYAIVVLAKMSVEPGLRYSSTNVASMTSVPEPTAAKILKDLARSGLVTSSRGAQGGYVLGKPAHEITVRAVIEALEGPIAMVECIDHESVCCATEKKCPLRGRWDIVNSAIIGKLDEITLKDMIAPKTVQIMAAE